MPNPDGTPTFEEQVAAASGQTPRLPKGTPYDHIGANGYIYHMIADGYGSGTIDPKRPPESSPGTKEPTQRQDSPPVVGDEQGGRWQWNAATSRYDIPVTPPKPAAPPPKNYTPYTLPNGQPGVLDGTTGTYHPIIDQATGQPITDPYKAQEMIDKANEAAARIASTNVQTGIAINTDARNTAIYNRDTTRQQAIDDQALQKQAFEQGKDVYDKLSDLTYTRPRQYQADVNQARAYRGQDAERQVNAATNRETLGQRAGDQAVSRAQWAAERTIGPEGVAAMRGAAGGAPVSPASFVTPIPRWEDIFGQARGQAVAQVPSYQQAVDSTPEYGVYAPGYDESWNYFNQHVIPPYEILRGSR